MFHLKNAKKVNVKHQKSHCRFKSCFKKDKNKNECIYKRYFSIKQKRIYLKL